MLVSADTCASKMGSIVRIAVQMMEVGFPVVVPRLRLVCRAI
jgi:hypothetical protein